MGQLYHQAIEKRDLYVGCGLAVELAEMLVAMEESEEADALFFHTVRASRRSGTLPGLPGERARIWHAVEASLRPGSSAGVD